MSTAIVRGVRTNKIGDETHNLNDHEPEEVHSATKSINTPVTSEEVSRLIKAATDPLTNHLEWLCDLIK